MGSRHGVIDALETLNPAASARFDVDAGDPSAGDRLIVQDLGLGDLDIQRQGPDGRSGSVTVGGFNPVVYKNVKRVDITPLDPVTSGTGTDAKGRIVVFQADPFESNDSRLNAGQLTRVGQNVTSPGIAPGGSRRPSAPTATRTGTSSAPPGRTRSRSGSCSTRLRPWRTAGRACRAAATCPSTSTTPTAT